MYEIYTSTEGKKKTYLVFDEPIALTEAELIAAKFFKVSKNHIGWDVCWILNDELYFENPHKKAAKKKVAIFWRK